MPCAGTGAYFKSALQSALSQTHREFRILVCDNACPHNHYSKVVRDINDPRVEYIRFEERLQMIANWQRCAAKAEADFYCFLHDDDLWEANFLSSCLSLLGGEGTNFVLAMHQTFHGDAEVALQSADNDLLCQWRALEALSWMDCRVLLAFGTFAHMSCALFRRILVTFDQTRAWNPDQKFIFEYGRVGKGRLSAQTCVHLRMHAGTGTASFLAAKASQETLTLIRENLIDLVRADIVVAPTIQRLAKLAGSGALFRVLHAVHSWPLTPELMDIGRTLLADPSLKREVAKYSLIARTLAYMPSTVWIAASLAVDLTYYREIARDRRRTR